MTAFSSLVLVFATAAVALGLAAVAAGLEPGRPDGSVVSSSLTATTPEPGARARRTEATLEVSNAETAWAPFMPIGPPRDCPDGDCKSPLYPQNGVTLWDRIRSSERGDHRANLLGTGIQVHVPSVAATPGPVRTP